MGEAGGEPDSRHDLLAFHCNFAAKDGEPCSRPIKEGWVTACSHLLCDEHGREWFQGHEDCPVCRAGRVRVLRMDLSQASVKRRGRLQLVGMPPPEILEAAERALSFWVDQKVFEFQRRGRRQGQLLGRQRSVEELIKRKLHEAEEACNALEAEQRALQQRIDERERDNSRVSEELRRLRRDLAVAEEQYAGLQRSVAGERPQELRRPLAPVQGAARAPLWGASAGAGAPCAGRAGGRGARAAEPQVGAFSEFLGADPRRRQPGLTPLCHTSRVKRKAARD